MLRHKKREVPSLPRHLSPLKKTTSFKEGRKIVLYLAFCVEDHASFPFASMEASFLMQEYKRQKGRKRFTSATFYQFFDNRHPSLAERFLPASVLSLRNLSEKVFHYGFSFPSSPSYYAGLAFLSS